MAWVRLDDQAPRNEKMLKAGPAACWLWVCGIAHAQSQLTDGFISREALPMIGVKGEGRCVRLADELVKVGLFDKADGGYVVHDYLAHNPSKAQVMAKRAEDSARKQRGDLERNPRGIHTESRSPRAGIPSHPIPSEKASLSQKLPVVDDAEALRMRAGELVNHYAQLFYEHRKGARYHARPALDFPKACELVQTWADDARLEKLAVLVLTTDDEWIARTDRGFAVFAARASWADDKLRAWELEHGISVTA